LNSINSRGILRRDGEKRLIVWNLMLEILIVVLTFKAKTLQKKKHIKVVVAYFIFFYFFK